MKLRPGSGAQLNGDKVAAILLSVPALLFLLFILIPLATIFLNLAPQSILVELHNQQVTDALSLGLVTSLIATLVSFVFGIPTAYLLATRNFPGKKLMDAVMDIPMILPPAVAGLALLLAFAPRGLLGPSLLRLGIILPGSTVAVVLAQLFVASPFVVTIRESRI